ncbi:uncharacterized protein LOC143919627 [Arctopsyche grandis]|uniref:uncharacterized protein LOC143919627 n=1 Tax=Arctopsyche grandis TaxID=121162 RepID=UPI00406D9F0E
MNLIEDCGFPVKLFIEDINKLEKHEGQPTYVFHNMKFKTIEAHGTIMKVIEINSTLNFQLADLTGCINVFLYQNCQIRDEKKAKIAQNIKKCKQSLSAESSQALDTLCSSANDDRLMKGDIVSIVGSVVFDPILEKNIINAFHCYKTSLTNDFIWNENVLHLYRNYYNRK